MDLISNQTRLCLVIPSMHYGGMEKVMCELATFLSTISSIKVHIIIYTKSEINFILPDNIMVVQPEFTFNRSQKIFFTLKTLVFLRKAIRKINPISILSFGEMYNSFVLISTLFLKTKVFVSDRSKPDKSWGVFHNMLRRLIYKRAYGIIAQTTYAANFLKAEVKHQHIKVIPNPVHITGSPINHRTNTILTVGRLIETKNIDLLIELFRQLDNENWELWIVGDGPKRKELEDLVKIKNLSSQVIFYGNRNDVYSFYQKAGIFAFTSVSEGFPNALLEACANGLPVVSFDCIAGPSDIIKDGINGFLIPELDLKSYLKKLHLLISDSALREKLGNNARESVKPYDIKVIGQKYFEFMLS